jgi:hypothetical protein
MKQEFVPYELAFKLIYELGFKEKCLATIDQSGYLHIKGTKSSPRGSMLYDIVDCPTFSQAFRWFREEYNQHSFIELVFEDEIRFDYVLYVNEDEADCIDYGDGPFETYEDAELALLDKLIEIAEGIKSKK